MRGKLVNLKLEDYVKLYTTPQQLFVTKIHLNEIISMHGFLKLTKAPKTLLMDEVKTISLESPHRSTLKENISSSAFLTPDSVKNDLDVLQWNDCLIQSIHIHQCGGKENLPLEEDLNQLPANSTSIILCADNSKKQKRKRKHRPLQKLPTLVAHPSSTTTTTPTPTADSSCLVCHLHHFESHPICS